ncbi:PorT family protein [Chryseobacterium phosphatilyticum]|uniref:PorT family protein n=1 Tax=Chryseobacterium phosphatilyticum TaxID=475075 RepID=A0A316XJ40_9FLAO|nr:porin family protein [Chryseobacterium phosphatilyticum]PWN71428.1 PorT family protein [Chryseobacterium phosphatilyticum]
MKKLFLCLVFSGGLLVNAQENENPPQKEKSSSPVIFGMKAGFNTSTYNSISENEGFDNNEKLKAGFNAGLFVNIPVEEKFNIQPELLFTQLGSKTQNRFSHYSNVYGFATDSSHRTTLNYLVLPIMVQYNILPQLYVETGPEFGLLLGGKIKGEQTTTEVSGNKSFSYTEHFSGKIEKDFYNTFNFGVGIAAGYYLTQNLAATARFTAGLTGIYKNSPSDSRVKNNSFQIGLAYKFK